MFLLVRSLMIRRLPALRSWQSGSFALPESGMVCGCVRFPLPRKELLSLQFNNGYTAQKDLAWRIKTTACCPASS
jgi:hypothetical protein